MKGYRILIAVPMVILYICMLSGQMCAVWQSGCRSSSQEEAAARFTRP